MHAAEAIILFVTVGIIAQWLAWRFRTPSIVVLMVSGLIVGPTLGWLNPSESFGDELNALVEVCVAIILFEGGLNLRYFEFKVAGGGVRRLITLGLIFNWVLSFFFAHYVGGFSWGIAIFIAAILIVTGPTVIMPILKQSRLTRRPASYLKWEGILNDPLGALLAVIVFEYLIFSAQPHEGFFALQAIQNVTGSLALGVISSGLMALCASWIIQFSYKRGLVPDYLKVPVVLTTVLAIFLAANSLQTGGGLIACTIMGVYLGNVNIPLIEDLRRFKESLSVFILSTVFILLSANIDFEVFMQLEPKHFAYLATVLFVVRPAAIFLATLGSEMNWKERLIMSWIAPRGIVAASVAGALGPRLVDAGYADGRLIFPMIFAIIFLTVTLHGFTLPIMARALNVSAKRKNGVLIVGGFPFNIKLARCLKALNIPVLVSDTSKLRLKKARKWKIPVHWGPILVDVEEGKPDLSEFRQVFVGTENDSYNALVSGKLSHELGRKNCYQLPIPRDEREKDSEIMPAELKGVELKSKELEFENIMQKHFQGWDFSVRPLSDEEVESYKDPKKIVEQPDDLPLMLVAKSGELSFLHTDNHRLPEKGDSVLAFSPKTT